MSTKEKYTHWFSLPSKDYKYLYMHGRMYFYGMWYKPNQRLGLNLIEEAANNGHQRAQNFLTAIKLS